MATRGLQNAYTYESNQVRRGRNYWTECRAKHRLRGQAVFVGQNGVAVASGGEPAVAAANKKAGHPVEMARLFSAALFLSWPGRPLRERLRPPHIHWRNDLLSC